MRNIFIAFGLFGMLGACDRQKAAEQQPADRSQPTDAPVEERSAAGLDRSHAGQPVLDVQIRDPDGEAMSLAEVQGKGKPLLLNLWATWCAPCIKELPTLDRLAKRPGAPAVVALSQDSGDQAKVRAFLDARGVALEPFQDADMAASSGLGAQILPTTVLYGKDGKEIWRYSGDMDWTGAEAAKLLAEAR